MKLKKNLNPKLLEELQELQALKVTEMFKKISTICEKYMTNTQKLSFTQEGRRSTYKNGNETIYLDNFAIYIKNQKWITFLLESKYVLNSEEILNISSLSLKEVNFPHE